MVTLPTLAETLTVTVLWCAAVSVITYPVTELPPLLLGAFQLTVALRVPALALTLRGAVGELLV